MLDDFFIRAIVGGIGVAVVAGPLGCFVIWRRLAYFGDTLSHSALLGVALALLLELNITFTVFCISVVVAMLLMLLQRRASLSSDALLGLLAHSALAVGLVVLAYIVMFYPSKQLWYRKAIQIPFSLVIGLIGVYWFFERVFF